MRTICCREALQDENDALRDQLERCGGSASPPALRRSLSAGSSVGLLPSPLPGSPAPSHLQQSYAPGSSVQRSAAVHSHSPSAPCSDDGEVTPTAAAPPGAVRGADAADGRHEHLAAELAAAHSRIAELQQALQAAVDDQNGGSAAVTLLEGHAPGCLEAEEMQQLQQAVRDAEADAAAAQDVACGAELAAEDARQQYCVLQVGDALWGKVFAPMLSWSPTSGDDGSNLPENGVCNCRITDETGMAPRCDICDTGGMGCGCAAAAASSR
jgi:hypothetical protein